MALRSTANTDYLSGTVLSGAVPLTVACWFRCDAIPATGTFQAVWSIDDNVTNWTQVAFANPAGTAQITHGFSHGNGDPILLSGATANTWYGIVSLIQPGTPGVAFLSTGGGAPIKVTDTTNITPNSGNFASTVLTLFNETGHDEFLNGDIALFAAWDRLLSEQEARRQLMLRRPVSGNKLRYWLPFAQKGGPVINRGGYGVALTHTGSLGWSPQQPPVFTRSARHPIATLVPPPAATASSDGLISAARRNMVANPVYRMNGRDESAVAL